MISIRKYLDTRSNSNAANTAPGDLEEEAGRIDMEIEPTPAGARPDAFYGMAAGLLDCIEKFVLSGEQDEPLRAELTHLNSGVSPNWSLEEAAQAVEAVRRILRRKNEALQQKGVKQAIEMQHIFAMLNQALIVLAEGKDRSVARLNRIQESLQRAYLIDDMVALKSSLSDTVRFVKAESVKSNETSTKEVARFEQEVNKAREFLGDSRLELAGRHEGVNRITDSLTNLPPGESVYLVAFLLDRLQAFIQRYGPPVAEELVFRVIKERVQPIAASDTTFRWTSSSLVAVLKGQRDLAALQNQVNRLNSLPLVHRIALGNRTAVLTIKPSHLVAEGGPGSADALIDKVDQFTGIQA